MTVARQRVGWREDVLDELVWTLRGRRGWLIGIAVNLILGIGYALYTVYNPNDHWFLRSANGVAANVALFVLSDPINTNQTSWARTATTSYRSWVKGSRLPASSSRRTSRWR